MPKKKGAFRPREIYRATYDRKVIWEGIAHPAVPWLKDASKDVVRVEFTAEGKRQIAEDGECELYIDLRVVLVDRG